MQADIAFIAVIAQVTPQDTAWRILMADEEILIAIPVEIGKRRHARIPGVRLKGVVEPAGIDQG